MFLGFDTFGITSGTGRLRGMPSYLLPPLGHTPTVSTSGFRTGTKLRDADFARCLESRRAVNPAPNANLSRGPNVFAADVPTKYRPDKEDSKFDDNTGVCSTDRILAWMAASMKVKRRRSTL